MFLDKIEKFKRAVWIPKIGEGEFSVSTSRFLSDPYLVQGEEWPVCPNCNKPMQFFLQLNIQELPDEFVKLLEIDEGLLQLFYCTSMQPYCDLDCETYLPFANNVLARIVSLDKSSEAYEKMDYNVFTKKAIIGWERTYDFPSYAELEEMGIQMNEEEMNIFSELNYPLDKDKLGGWPSWSQLVSYPKCPNCNKPMKYLLQLDSECNIPFVFGEYGFGILTQCGEHKDVLSFHWECG